MPQTKKAIVIGAGIAGIAAAIRLSVQGFEVIVYEKNEFPGGKLSHFSKEGYRFDAGPSLFTQPANVQELFDLANEPMAPYFSYQSLPVSFKYFYEDGLVINAYTNNDLLADELANKLGEKKSATLNYLRDSKKVYENIATVFLNHSLHNKKILLKAKIVKAIKTVRFKYLFKTMHQVNASYFTTPHAIQLFNRFATYNGSNPYKAPGMLSLIPHLELSEGTFYPKGGMISITNALYALALKKGVQFFFNSKVEKISHENNKVTAVEINGKTTIADIVVSNMDAYFTYKYLLNNSLAATNILKQERSSSAFIFYWGINASFPQLELHNIFFTKDYPLEFESLFTTKTIMHDPTIYVNITSKMEPGVQAPENKENWFVMVNAPANTSQDWTAYQQQYRTAIIKKLNRILGLDIEPLIEVEEILDPVMIETKTASYMGSLYGTSSNSKMAAFLRHPNFSNKMEGLYFVGGSVHPGGGIPLCLKSAKIMSDLVAAKYTNQ